METRNKLLDAAVAVFIERGFTRSSVDEICRRAGTTKGAFFHHFESKQEVGLLALDRFAERMIASLSNVPTGKDPLHQILECLDRQPIPTCLLAVLTLELGSDDLTFRSAARAAYERVLSCIEKLIVEAAPFAVKPRELAELYLATMEGSLILARAREDRSIIDNNLAAFKTYLGHLKS